MGKADDSTVVQENVQTVLGLTSALGARLVQLGDEDELDSTQLVEELTGVQQDLQVARDRVHPDYQDVRSILDDQRADHWWQRKLIATLPMAVLETDIDGRIIWANNAAAEMFDRQVLKLVRTRVHSYLHSGDHDDVEAVLAGHVESPEDDAPPSRAVVRLNPGLGGALLVDLTRTVRSEGGLDRTVITWVLEPMSDRNESGVDESLIAHTFSELCMLPLQSGSLQELLAEVARLCEDVCASDSSVSVTIGPPAEPQHLASSTEFAQRIDAAQMEANEGPCQQAWETNDIVYSNDALQDSRWPQFAQKAEDIGLGSALAAPIRVGDEVLGVLNIYSRDTDAFAVAGLKVVELLADAAGAVVHHVDEEKQLKELTRQLEQAMHSREIIEQAKGILMVQYRCSADEAFARLTKVSQNRNVRIRELAQTLIDSVTGAETASDRR